MEESDSEGNVKATPTQNQGYMPEEIKPESSGFSKAKFRGSCVLAAASSED
jgi:hypothetical protein